MPKVPIDYSKTHFYKIVCNDTTIKDMYIGHTTQFTKRKHQHKIRCCNPNNPKHHFKVYKFIRDNGHWENWNMILIDTLPCEGKLDALKKEREIYEELKPSLNVLRPLTTDEEKLYDMRQQTLKSNAKVCQDRINNPEKYKEIDRNSYLKRRDKVLENNRTKVDCSCGGSYTLSNKSEHLKTKKHQQYLQSIEN